MNSALATKKMAHVFSYIYQMFIHTEMGYSKPMMKSDYLKTPRGRYSRYRWRQLRGFSYYSFKEEPKSKVSMSESQQFEFRQKLLGMVRAAKRRVYRAPIIAEISFSTADKNPPHIHTVVKNYQDLFEGLVYNDDKYILGLSVRYHLGDDDPEMSFSFYPFRYFIQDLELASDIMHDSEFKYEWEEEYGHHHDYYRSIETLKNFIHDRDEYVRAVGEDGYNAMLLSHRISVQEQLLSGLSLNIDKLSSFYSPIIMENKFDRKLSPSKNELEKIPEITSEWIANSPIRIKLPNAPLKDGDTKIFKQEIRNSLSTFQVSNPLLKPLLIPVNLNILYKPPKGSKDNYNDLDNVMRKIVPAFNEIFKPPSTYVSHMKLDKIRDENLYRSLKEMQDKIPKSIRTSISGYDIFKIPRLQDDESAGYLTANISSGTSSQITLTVDRIIDKWKNLL